MIKIKKEGIKKCKKNVYELYTKYRGTLMVLAFTAFYFIAFSNIANAEDKDIFKAATNFLNTTKGDILNLSSAAAVIGIGSGVFMKKFSMGKQDKVELGNKIMRDSVIGWAILNGSTYILNYVGQFIGVAQQ